MCVFVSLTVKAVHLEAVSDLTSKAFIAALRCFIACRGHPSFIWSDNGTNFVGANRQLKEFYDFLAQQKTEGIIAEFRSARNVEWRFIPEHGPTLVDCGKRQSRVPNLTSDGSWDPSSSHLKSSQPGQK